MLVVKQEFCRKVPSCPHYQQKLLIDNPREELVDDRVLSSYPSLKSGSTINLLRIPPWELHVTDMYGKQHTVAVPSIKPKVFYTQRDCINVPVHCMANVYTIEHVYMYMHKQLYCECSITQHMACLHGVQGPSAKLYTV